MVGLLRSILLLVGNQFSQIMILRKTTPLPTITEFTKLKSLFVKIKILKSKLILMAPKKCRTKLIKLTLWIALAMKKKLQKLWRLKEIKTTLTLRITSNLQGSTQVISIKEINETTAIVICWMGHRTLPLKRLPLSISKCLKVKAQVKIMFSSRRRITLIQLN